jgi:hypothetical protein
MRPIRPSSEPDPPTQRLSGMRTAPLLTGLAVVLVAAACGDPGAIAINQPLADTAVVVCEDDVTRIETAAVETHRDGVHFRVQNPADEERMFLIYGHGSNQVSPGTLELTRTVPPGELRVACVGPEEAGEFDEEGGNWPYPQDDEWMVIQVVDRDGYWTDDTLSCEYQTGFHNDYPWDFHDEPMPAGEKGDLVDLARRDLPRELGELGTIGLGDVVEPAGYSGVSGDVRLVRDGETVATIWYRSDGQGGWHLGGVDYCDESWRSSGPEPDPPDEEQIDVEP